jgi:arylsulfatase A-like enzyme
MVAALDDSVGEVARALRNSGLMDNTIIVFSTDNGGPANGYDGNAACNYPLR